MNHKEFILNLKNYYGEYPEIVELTISEYVVNNFHQDELDKLFKLITDKYTNIYKMPPDKAKIIELVNEFNSQYYYEPERKIGKLYYKLLSDKKNLLTNASVSIKGNPKVFEKQPQNTFRSSYPKTCCPVPVILKVLTS